MALCLSPHPLELPQIGEQESNESRLYDKVVREACSLRDVKGSFTALI